MNSKFGLISTELNIYELLAKTGAFISTKSNIESSIDPYLLAFRAAFLAAL